MGLAVIGASVAIAAIVLVNIAIGSASATHSYWVVTSEGISLDEVIRAFNNETLRNELDISDITVFVKSGGIKSDGQNQDVLRVNLPVKTPGADRDVSFQYFVDIQNDLTGSNSFHCGDIRFHVFLNGKESYTSEWMGFEDRHPSLPLNTQQITIHRVQGNLNEITLIPEGRLGGCNPGYLQSWGGTVVLSGQ